MVIIATVIIFSIANPSFLSLAHLFGVGRSTVYIGLMALGVMLVLLTGGIDISVSAIAVSSMYLTTVTLMAFDYQGTFLAAVALAVLIGGLLGLVNGVLVTWLKLPSLIVTIGTLTLYRGALLAFVGTDRFRSLPAQMAEFSGFAVFRTSDNGRIVALHGAVLILIVIGAVLALALSRSWWGRYIYAIGDNEEAAERMGVPVRTIRVTAFVLSGALAGLAGLFYAAMSRTADPASLSGVEMTVLAAVVLGGVAVTGGARQRARHSARGPAYHRWWAQASCWWGSPPHGSSSSSGSSSCSGSAYPHSESEETNVDEEWWCRNDRGTSRTPRAHRAAGRPGRRARRVAQRPRAQHVPDAAEHAVDDGADRTFGDPGHLHRDHLPHRRHRLVDRRRCELCCDHCGARRGSRRAATALSASSQQPAPRW